MTKIPNHGCLLIVFPLLLGSRVHGFIVANPKLQSVQTVKMVGSDSANNSNDKKWSYPPEFHRAVECAKNQGLCNVDELLSLAEELEQYNGCKLDWEVEMTTTKNNDQATTAASSRDDDCEKETLDRLDIADLLRTEGECTLRRQTIEFSNLFKENIEEEEEEDDGIIRTNSPSSQVIDMYSGFYESMYSKICGP